MDTSIWIDHFRQSNHTLEILLNQNQVFTHPHIIGEVACGRLKNRKEILFLLSRLPIIDELRFKEVLTFIDAQKLHGQGVGWIDVHLLGSCILAKSSLWTNDKSLKRTALMLEIDVYKK